MEKAVSFRILYVLGALLIAAACLGSAHGSSYHALCASRPTLVQIDHPQYRYYPFFVTLNRCGGSCSTHPNNQQCSPTAEEEVKIQVFDMARNKPVELVMKNHRACKCMCVASFDSCRLDIESWEPDNCRCKCRYPKGPPEDRACKPGFIWNGDICRCQCNLAPEVCPPNKVWSDENCGCICSKRVTKRCDRKGKGLNTENCECVDIQALLRRDPTEENQKSARMFITLLVGQGFLLVVILCVLIHFIRKSKRRTPSADREINNTPKPAQSPGDSGNVSINSCHGTSDQGLTSKQDFKNSNGSIELWNGFLVSKETVID